MKQFSVILVFLALYTLSLFSCVGISPSSNSTEDEPITMQDGGATSPVLTKELTTNGIESTIDPSCKNIGYEAWANEETGESGTGKAICLDMPTPTPHNAKKYSLEEQAAVATALAYLGDKAPYLKVESVGDRSVPGYIVHFDQVYQGIPVSDGRIIIVVEPNESPWISLDRYYEGVNIPSITPTLILEEAVAVGIQTLGITESYRINVELSNLHIVKVPTKRESTKGTKTPFKDRPQKYVLAWRSILSLDCPQGIWNMWIDANTGGVLGFSSGMVWEVPTPTPNCPIPEFVRPTAALAP